MQNSIKKTERVLRLFYRFFCEDAEGFLRPSRCAFPFDAGRYFPTSVRILLCRNKSRLNRNVLRLPSCFSSLRLKRRLFPRCYGYAISGYGIFPGPTPCFQAASGIGTTPQSGDVKTPVGVESKRKRGPIFCKCNQTDRHSLSFWPRGTPHRLDVCGGLSGRSLPTEPRCA